MTESQIFISNRCFEKGKRQVLLSPRSSKITVTKEKEGEKERARGRKEGEEKKVMVALLVFIIASLEIVLGRKRSIWRYRFQKSG